MVIWEHLKNKLGNIDASLTTTIDSKNDDVIFIFGSDGKLKIMAGGNSNDMGRNQGRPDF